MNYDTLMVSENKNVVTVALNRPEVHNAMNELLIKELTGCFAELNNKKNVRAIILTGNGKSFCGGADLNWMKSMIKYSKEENIKDSKKLLNLFETIYSCRKPVIGRINGNAFGGGLGLIAVCDIVIAVPGLLFAFSETKLGIIPSVVSTYVIRRIGPANARRLFITGERFSSEHAKEIGLIDCIVPSPELDARIQRVIEEMKTSAPLSIGEAKNLVKRQQEMAVEEYKEYRIHKIAELRVSEEGQEGTIAFLEKRKPKWRD